MMFSRDGWRPRVRRAATLAAVAALATLVSCGGGEQVSKFQPARVLAFGDEASVIEPDGRKFNVNFQSDATATPPLTLDCAQNAIGVQGLAAAYGLPFPECPGAVANPPSRILATAGAKTADVSAQVDSFLLADTFHGNDLVMIMAGSNDLLALLDQTLTGSLSVDQAAAAAEQAGTNLSNVVNRVATLGAKVLISTIPDLSLSPDGRDPAKNATLHRLSQRFNAKLRTGLINDGHMIGLVLFDEDVQAIVNNPAFNTTDRICDDAHLADLRTCTTQTLRTLPDGTTASITTWLWADGTHVGPVGHNALASLAFTRASNNPF
jgi:phospholipase/lecithinase/hemolysin